MKTLTSQISIILFLAVTILAQKNQPILIDEFGKMPLDEMMARVDNLGIKIVNIPRSKALIRISGGQELGFTFSYIRGSLLKAIWKNTRMYPAENLVIQFCDVNKMPLQTQFYVVREGDRVETCEENFIIPKVTTLYETVGFYSPEFKLIPQENTVAELAPAEGEYSGYALDSLKKSLNDSPESKVFVIAYLSTNFEINENGKIIKGKRSKLDKKTFAAQMLRAARNELLKNGFPKSKIMTIDGGYINNGYRGLEFWFVPKGGEVPKPKPDYFPKKNKKNKLHRQRR